MKNRSIAFRCTVIALWLAAAVASGVIYMRHRIAQHQTRMALEMDKAIIDGDLGKVRALVRAGADVNAKVGDGTVLFQALFFHNQDAVDLLLTSGASTRIDRPGEFGNLFKIACEMCPRDKPHKDRLNALLWRLLKEGQDVNCRDHYGHAPLHLLAGNGEYDLVREVIARGADVNVRDYEGKTPLHYAAQFNQIAVARFLLAHGANPLLRNSAGETPLAVARKQKHAAMAALLMTCTPHADARSARR